MYRGFGEKTVESFSQRYDSEILNAHDQLKSALESIAPKRSSHHDAFVKALDELIVVRLRDLRCDLENMIDKSGVYDPEGLRR